MSDDAENPVDATEEKPKPASKPRPPKLTAFEKEVKAEFADWKKEARKTKYAFIAKLTGKKKDLAFKVLRDMAEVKLRASKGQHVGRQLAYIESTLQDLAASTTLNTMQAIRDVMQAAAGPATKLLSSMFGRILNRF